MIRLIHSGMCSHSQTSTQDWTNTQKRLEKRVYTVLQFLSAYEAFYQSVQERRPLESNIRASGDQNEPIKQQLQHHNREKVQLEFHYICFLSHLFICSSWLWDGAGVSRTIGVETSALTWTHLLRKNTQRALIVSRQLQFSRPRSGFCCFSSSWSGAFWFLLAKLQNTKSRCVYYCGSFAFLRPVKHILCLQHLNIHCITALADLLSHWKRVCCVTWLMRVYTSVISVFSLHIYTACKLLEI